MAAPSKPVLTGLDVGGAPVITVTAAGTVAAMTCVALDSNGKGDTCGAGKKPIGYTIYGGTANNPMTVHPCIGTVRMRAGAQFAKGDYLKVATGGGLEPESPAGTQTVATVAQAKEAAAGADYYAMVVWV